jgi:hypothetical protein
MEKVEVFTNFFFNFEIGHKKCPKWILKKKFAKMKTTFFPTFF